MAIIEPEKTDVDHPQRVKVYSSSLRLWHWLNAIVITGSLLTVLLHSTLLDSHANGKVIKDNLHESGITIDDHQARSAAHEISDKGWTVHTYFGYTLAALLLFRLIAEFFQLADQKLIRKIKSAYKKYFVLKQDREIAKHEFWVKTLYAVFYLMLFTMVVTGLCLAFEDDVPLLKSIHAFRQIHSFTMYLILAFITVHIVGVLLAERKQSKGIISDMINGGSADGN